MLSYLILYWVFFPSSSMMPCPCQRRMIWDMRKWDEPLEPNTALCHSSQSPSSFQAYELAAKYTTVVNIYIFWHFQFSSPAISCECCNGWAAASRLGTRGGVWENWTSHQCQDSSLDAVDWAIFTRDGQTQGSSAWDGICQNTFTLVTIRTISWPILWGKWKLENNWWRNKKWRPTKN